jgi:hypothetical protein
MAGVDASIPLSYQFPKLPTGQDLAAYQQMQYRNQLAQLSVEDAQQQQQQNNALVGILKQPGAIGDDGLPTQDTVGKVMQVSPQAGMKLANSLSELQARRQEMVTNTIHQRLLGLQVNAQQNDELTDIATRSQSRFDDLIKSGTPRAEAIRIVGQERNQAIDDAQKQGILLPDQARTMQIPFDPDVNRAFISGSPQYKRILDEKAAQQRANVQEDRERRLENNDNTRTDNSGMTPFMKEAAAEYGKDTPEYRQAISDHLKKQQGAPGTGGRESVYTARVLQSANQAALDLSNVAKLPATTSLGMFSRLGGENPNATLMQTTKAMLGNTVTDNEAQLYQTMSTGFQRTLAGIESSGLAPSGSLSHQMDQVIIKPGDTELNKLSKLAQTKQIIISGMQVLQDNPRVSQEEKGRAQKIIDQVNKAIPWDQEDIIAFSQSKDPKATFSDYAKKTVSKDDKSSGGGASGSISRPKSKAEYDALPSGTRVILPNGKEGVKP